MTFSQTVHLNKALLRPHHPVRIIDDILSSMPFAKAHQLNLKLNRQKCKFHVNEVPFVGHILTFEGVHCDQSKINDINNLEKTKYKTDMRRFFCMCNYVSKFIPNYSEKSANLRELLKGDIAWYWDVHRPQLFNE